MHENHSFIPKLTFGAGKKPYTTFTSPCLLTGGYSIQSHFTTSTPTSAEVFGGTGELPTSNNWTQTFSTRPRL